MNATAAILAGGLSRRMGTDKAFLPLGGRPLIEYVLSVCREIFPEILIVTKEPRAFEGYPERKVQDVVEAGVLGGLYTALLESPTPYLFCVACDMPFLRHELIRFLLTQGDRYDVVIPRAPDGLHPLCALYSKMCINTLSRAIERGEKRIMAALSGLKVKYCGPEELEPIDPAFSSFFNVNTPEDLRKAEELLRIRSFYEACL